MSFWYSKRLSHVFLRIWKNVLKTIIAIELIILCSLVYIILGSFLFKQVLSLNDFITEFIICFFMLSYLAITFVYTNIYPKYKLEKRLRRT